MLVLGVAPVLAPTVGGELLRLLDLPTVQRYCNNGVALVFKTA